MDVTQVQPLDRVVWRSDANRELREGHVIRNLPERRCLSVTNARQFEGVPILIEYRQVIEVGRFPESLFQRGD